MDQMEGLTYICHEMMKDYLKDHEISELLTP